MNENEATFPTVRIETLIHSIRGKKVILDSSLADLYGVPTKRFNEQSKRNIERFPDDFMFVLTEQEFTNLRSQFATSSSHGGRRYLPKVFTEHGALMAANVLNLKIQGKNMIRWNWLISMAICILPISLLAESELLLNGATYVAFSSKRPDLSLGFGYSYKASTKFRLSCNLNYSFRHQIAASEEDFPIVFAFFQDSLIRRVDEYIIDRYKEKGYCFSLNLIPEYIFNHMFFGAGIGFELGNYTSHYTYKVKGQSNLVLRLPEVAQRNDNNIIFLFLVGYEVSPIKITANLIWKRFQNTGIGINIGWAFWKSK